MLFKLVKTYDSGVTHTLYAKMEKIDGEIARIDREDQEHGAGHGLWTVSRDRCGG